MLSNLTVGVSSRDAVENEVEKDELIRLFVVVFVSFRMKITARCARHRVLKGKSTTQ